MNTDDLRAFFDEMSTSEQALRDAHASGEFDREAIWRKTQAHTLRFFRRYYAPPWPLTSGSPGSSKAQKRARAQRPIRVHKLTPYDHPELELWVVAVSEPYDSSPPYGVRFAVAELDGALRVVGHQQVCAECYPAGGCDRCRAGWLGWDEGNAETLLLDELGSPSGPAHRVDDPGERFALLHSRED